MPYALRPDDATLAEAESRAMTNMFAATEASLTGVADADAKIEMAVEDMVGNGTRVTHDEAVKEDAIGKQEFGMNKERWMMNRRE